jgi:hypothetical protein
MDKDKSKAKYISLLEDLASISVIPKFGPSSAKLKRPKYIALMKNFKEEDATDVLSFLEIKYNLPKYIR